MFGKLASMFVEVENAPPPQEKKPAQPAPGYAAATSVVPPTQPATVQIAAPAIPGAVDEKMVNFLSQAIEEANIPGFDYIEFRNALAAMASAPLPENQKYIAVFTTASTMGLTKDGLLKAIDHYQGILDSKKKEFQIQVDQMNAREVTKREDLKTAKEAEIQTLLQQIQEAQAAIAAKQQEALEINSEIGRERLNIQQTAASFEATYNFVSGKLQGDKQKIETYIVVA
jgi:hypothetical protein